MRRALGNARPAGQQATRNTVPPISNAMPAKPSQRQTATATETAGCLPASAAPTAAALTGGAATPKVKAPATGCVSAETTRQLTT